MKKLLILLLFPIFVLSQNNYKIETIDIDNFWKAYDLLAFAQSKEDSIATIQEHYIDKATNYFKVFIKKRRFTAKEYVKKIKKYPKFWKSIRPLTEAIVNRKPEIEKIFEKYRETLPNFKQPNVCFAIGTLRTGGTINKGLILIGSEIAASTPEVDTSEMSGWLKSIIGKTGDIVSMIAHETVHTQQFNKKKFDLLIGTMSEGIADFITNELIGLYINLEIHEYGEKHECELWKAFDYDLKNHKKEYKRWLYQGNRSKDKPADLGYFIGYKIAKAYYDKQKDKKNAIMNLLNVKKYKMIFEESEYWLECCD